MPKKFDRIQEGNIFQVDMTGFVFFLRSHLATANKVCILGGLGDFHTIFFF
jgi:hypothetical protein